MILQAHDRNKEDPNVLLELRGTPGWSESPEKITATLPKEGLHDGCALVWVVTREGVESNAQLVLQLADLPDPVVNAVFEQRWRIVHKLWELIR